MGALRTSTVLLAAFALCLSFAVPGEDLPETAYDESEAMPYEGTAVFSLALGESPCAIQSAPPVNLFHLNPLSKAAKVSSRPGQRSAHPMFPSISLLGHLLRC